jgi:hypothetical protein
MPSDNARANHRKRRTVARTERKKRNRILLSDANDLTLTLPIRNRPQVSDDDVLSAQGTDPSEVDLNEVSQLNLSVSLKSCSLSTDFLLTLDLL